jgi:hypothetical protein
VDVRDLDNALGPCDVPADANGVCRGNHSNASYESGFFYINWGTWQRRRSNHGASYPTFLDDIFMHIHGASVGLDPLDLSLIICEI